MYRYFCALLLAFGLMLTPFGVSADAQYYGYERYTPYYYDHNYPYDGYGDFGFRNYGRYGNTYSYSPYSYYGYDGVFGNYYTYNGWW